MSVTFATSLESFTVAYYGGYYGIADNPNSDSFDDVYKFDESALNVVTVLCVHDMTKRKLVSVVAVSPGDWSPVNQDIFWLDQDDYEDVKSKAI